MSKKPTLTIIEQIYAEDCPEFQAYRELKKRAEQLTANSGAAAKYVADLEAAKQAASSLFYEHNSLANFKAYEQARTAHTSAEGAHSDLAQMHGATIQYQKDPENIRILLGALVVARDRLAKRIAALNDEERKRLEAAGVDPQGAEHPAISRLKGDLSALADKILYTKDYLAGELPGVFQWTSCSQLLKL